MGLDWNPLPAPLPGHEAEFDEIVAAIGSDSSRSFLKMLFSKPKHDLDALHARMTEISIEPHANLGAPVVGKDPEADAWARNLVEKSGQEMDLNTLQGLHVVDLLPVCDGFPVYTNSGSYDGVDRISFRGQFLKLARDVLGKEALNRAWDYMTAAELQAYGNQLLKIAAEAAAAEGLEEVLNNRDYPTLANPVAPTPADKIHLIDQAGRWCLFWSGKGHGLEPYF